MFLCSFLQGGNLVIIVAVKHFACPRIVSRELALMSSRCYVAQLGTLVRMDKTSWLHPLASFSVGF